MYPSPYSTDSIGQIKDALLGSHDNAINKIAVLILLCGRIEDLEWRLEQIENRPEVSSEGRP